MNRRGFLGGSLAACAAPAIVKAELLMPVRKIIVPEFQDITVSLEEFCRRRPLPRDAGHTIKVRAPAYTCFVPVDVYAEILKHGDTVPAKLYAGEVGVISHGIRFIESSRLYR